jgi:hypothetical protein
MPVSDGVYGNMTGAQNVIGLFVVIVAGYNHVPCDWWMSGISNC